MDNVKLSLISAVGMLVLAIGAVVYWRRVSKTALRWFWAGAGLWLVSVVMKLVVAVFTNRAVIGYMQAHLPQLVYVLAGSLFLGIQSSLFEIGLTLIAVLAWRQLGHDSNRAIAVGVGAGAFEALLLGLASGASIVACIAGAPGSEIIREGVETVAAGTPVFWLLATVERAIAIPCHTASRALVLLGVTRKAPSWVLSGFVLFALLDGVAGAAHVSGAIGSISMWWIELALLPFAVASILILRGCHAT